MLSLKRPGCCSLCLAEVFEVKIRRAETRTPLAVGDPLENAVLATFVLLSGSQMQLTMCADCMAALTPADYVTLWQRVMLGWIVNSEPGNPWAASQVDNGIVGLMHARPWKARNG